jgi:DNA-binding SARP family transcriptional activator
VLARLALAEGEAVARERIIEDIWGDDAPRSVVNTLQSYVSNLRRLLGDDTTRSSTAPARATAWTSTPSP